VSEHFLIFDFQNAGSMAVAWVGEGEPPACPGQKELLAKNRNS